MSSNHIQNQLIQSFNTDNLYTILNINDNDINNQNIIKQSFRRLSLLYHPDKGGNEEKFKCICIAYQILSNDNKKHIYDETLNVDEAYNDDEVLNDDNIDFWYNFYRHIFPKISIEKIEIYQNTYKSLSDYIDDIYYGYEKVQGDMKLIQEYILFMEDETYENDINDVINIIDNGIQQGILQSYEQYQQFKVNDLLKMKKKRKVSKNKINSNDSKDSLALLMNQIQSNQTLRNSMNFNQIFEKYETKSKSSKKSKSSNSNYDISDEEFIKIQSSLKK